MGLTRCTDPIRTRNDAYLGAAGEAVFGAGRQLRDFVYLKLSQGLGAGLVLVGRQYRGGGLAGNLGHVRVQDGGDVCVCGNRGCLETLVSAESLVRALQPAHPERALRVADLLWLSAAGDPGTLALLADAGRMIGRTLADVVTILNPAGIVGDGALGASGEPLLQGSARRSPATASPRRRRAC
jgi:predicted NBD/HSP70 family sugar kinase